MNATTKPIRTLSCCCCGESTRGRQWWNRDDGYGVCVKCATGIAKEDEGKERESLYGIRGVHWDINEGAES